MTDMTNTSESQSGFLPFDKTPMPSSKDVQILHQLDNGGSTCTAFSVIKEGKHCFMKCLKEEYRDSIHAREAFRKEYETGVNVNNPHVVRYLEYGERDGLPYLLTEYIRGKNLSQYLHDASSITEGEIERLMSGILGGLQALHGNGVVHLDLKPENIMVREVNNEPVIIDLGFCYTDSHLPTMGYTPSYVAPEVLDKTHLPDTRADIFSVGKILEKILQQPSLKGRHLKRYQKIINKACQRIPAKRYQNIEEIRHEFRGGYIKSYVPRSYAYSLLCLLALLAISVSLIANFNHRDSNTETTTFDDGWFVYQATPQIGENECEVQGFVPGIPDHSGPGIVFSQSDAVIPAIVNYKGQDYKVSGIADSAFNNCKKLQALTLPSTIKRIGQGAFETTAITSVIIPDSIEKLSIELFHDCRELVHVILPKYLKSIDKHCFLYCCKMETLIIPEGTQSIGVNAFISCHSLRNIKLPSTLETIGRGAFWECRKLKEIHIPSSVSLIGDFAFWHSGLTDIYMEATEPIQITDIFGKCTPIIHVPQGAKEAYQDMNIWNRYEIVEE